MSTIYDFWPNRRPRRQPVIDEQEPRTFKLPPDLERDIADAMDDYAGTKREPTAKELSNKIAGIEQELTGARQLIAHSEARVAELKLQLAKRLDMEIADLEALRPKGETHANTDDDHGHVGSAGDDDGAGSGQGMPDADAGPQGASDADDQVPADRRD